MMPRYDKCSSIAMFIAAAMQHPVQTNSGPVPSSSIIVSQHKNKFDQVCVYCALADYNLVAESWTRQGHEGAPTPEFLAKCMAADAARYRDAYRSMIDLVPDLKRMITVRADYGYLLHDDMSDVDAWLAKLTDDASLSPPMQAHINRLCSDWLVSDVIQLREQLRLVYECR